MLAKRLKVASIFLLVLAELMGGNLPLRADPNGLPIPRFVSLAFDEVNMRVGPMPIHRVKWRYRRQGLPVKVIQERDEWRLVEDPDGVQGWIKKTQLSASRSVIISASKPTALRTTPAAEGYIMAFLATGVIASLKQCQVNYCELRVRNGDGQALDGWAARQDLWGITPSDGPTPQERN